MSERRLYLQNFGCQMNDYDVGRIVEVMRREGYALVPKPEQADLVVINTCAIRENCENKVLSTSGSLRELKAAHKDMVVAIGGCVATQRGEALLRQMPLADLVFGPDSIPRLPELLGAVKTERRRFAATEFTDVEDYEFLDADPQPGDVRVSALVTIQKGCDNFCAYCVVPNTRGREVSRPLAEVVREAERFVAAGAREVTLIGQNVNVYSGAGGHGDDFPRLLEAVCAVPGLLRVRFTTSHPKYYTDRTSECFRDLPTLCKWLHLPVQSGSTGTLSRMLREYSREEYLSKLDYLRKCCPDVSVTTDIIVGFPGETDQEFHDTLSLLEIAEYDSIYSFKYSPRPGTPAFARADDIPADVKSDRLARVQALQRDITARKLGRMVGSTATVLVEGESKQGRGQMCGRTGGNHMVNFCLPDGRGTADFVGREVEVRITDTRAHTLRGELAEAPISRPEAPIRESIEGGPVTLAEPARLLRRVRGERVPGEGEGRR
jgi:tRNA-2-methylthio-N6-dimethylallyladenosine synthase